MRKLASIQLIWKIEPIEGADRIELAHVLGWQCVVNKGQFQPMDIGVYFEIDSFLPIRPVYEFMRSSSYKKTDIMGEGFKLRTMRFRGQISQGLLLPHKESAGHAGELLRGKQSSHQSHQDHSGEDGAGEEHGGKHRNEGHNG